MILSIVQYPNQILTRKSQPIKVFDADLCRLANDMAETMYVSQGIGLAAPQVGILSRLIVLDITQTQGKSNLITCVNPVIVSKNGISTWKEGCLSIPNISETITRAQNIQVRYQDVYGKFQKIEASGLLSTCLQHEIDHLDGILFIDKLSRLKRRLLSV